METETDRPVGLCEQVGCEGAATHTMYWPGQGSLCICDVHRRKALDMAMAMGFALVVQPIAHDPSQARTWLLNCEPNDRRRMITSITLVPPPGAGELGEPIEMLSYPMLLPPGWRVGIAWEPEP